MATLFFEGFDRGTFIRKLDPQYWSTQYYRNPPYAFGGYTYSNDYMSNNSAYNITYQYYSPVGGVLPTGGFVDASLYRSTSSAYPGFGQPPGFLALTNRRINDNTDVDPLGYIQLSGFPIGSGTTRYFGMRCLGIETKHEDYWEEQYPVGRFGYRHPLIAFCSGNITGCLMSVVSFTGNNLLPLVTEDPANNNEGKRISIGLEIEQNGSAAGIFDLNLSDTIIDYRITPVYCNESNSYNIPPSDPCKLLTIARDNAGVFNCAVTSRWTHFEFEINESGSLKLKIEGADALVYDELEEDRDVWEINLPISGFNFDNIRLFNRTYYTGIQPCALTENNNFNLAFGDYNGGINYRLYYARGELILFDDITLVDNTGNLPRSYLGQDCKVLPLHPGTVANTLVDSENSPDGSFGWNKSSSASYRATVASLDQDNTIIYADQSGVVNAVVYNNLNMSANSDTASLWRTQYNDGIGGLKVYNSARKAFLDTDFVNVFRGQTTDTAPPENTVLLIHGEEDPPIDYSLYNHTLHLVGNTNISTESKFGNGGISFDSNNDLIVADMQYDIGTGIFTLESWVYFNTNNDQLYLYSRDYRSDLSSYLIDGSISSNGYGLLGYSISCNTGSICFNLAYEYETFDEYGTPIYVSCENHRAKFILPFPSAIQTGEWHHVVLTKSRTSNQASGWFTVFLDGVSGTGHMASGFPGLGSFGLIPANCPGNITTSFTPGSYVFALNSNLLDPNSGGYWTESSGMLLHNLVAKRTYNLNSNLFLNYAYVGGSGLIDDLRMSSGIVRYETQFSPPTSAFKGPSEDYIQIGPTHNLTRSSYRTFQFYQMDNPDTSLPFTSGEIIRSGLVLGVKKL